MSSSPTSIRLGGGAHEVALLSSMVNRHGLIAGATGTGKTVTLRVLAERLSALGVPVFLPDVKGDLSGLAQAGSEQPKLRERIDQLGLRDFEFAACPTV